MDQITDYLARNKKAKEEFAALLGVSKKLIQRCIYELIDLADSNDGIITPEMLVGVAEDPASAAYVFFSKVQTPEEKLGLAEYIMDNLTFLISRDNDFYSITTSTGDL